MGCVWDKLPHNEDSQTPRASYNSMEFINEPFGTVRGSRDSRPNLSRLRAGSFVQDVTKSGILLRYILAHSDMSVRLLRIAEIQRCEEVIVFLKEMTMFLASSGDDDTFVDHIWEEYIHPDSPNMLHIRSALAENLHTAYNARSNETISLLRQVAHESFEDLKQSEVVARFIQTDPEAREYSENVDIIALQLYMTNSRVADVVQLFPSNIPLQNLCKFLTLITITIPLPEEERITWLQQAAHQFLDENAPRKIEEMSMYAKAFHDGDIDSLDDVYTHGLKCLAEYPKFVDFVRERISSSL